MKKNILIFGLIFIIGLVILYPSFHIDFDGDSYLTLWRYQFYQKTFTGNLQLHNIKYFFTDYGPQDTFFAIFYKVFGLNPSPFYIISFIFRYLASLSLFPLVYILTKNKNAAFISVLFFLVTSTGLESTSWVFNMPSYLAILLLNIYLLFTIKYFLSKKFEYFAVSLIFFAATIVFQPIRMIFLPFYALILEFFIYLQNKNSKNFVKFIAMSTLIITVVGSILLVTNIGDSVGLNINTSKVNTNLFLNLSNIFDPLSNAFTKGDVRLIFYPVAQIGKVVFPSNFLSIRFETLNTISIQATMAISSTFLFFFLLNILKKPLKLPNKTIAIFSFTSLISTIIFIVFRNILKDFFSFNNSVSVLAGWYFSLFVIFMYINRKKFKNIRLGIFLSFSLIVSSFIIPWLRNPSLINETTNRYLIVPAAGLAMLLGIVLGSFKKTPKIIQVLVITILLFSGLSSVKYLSHLAKVRGTSITEKIRNSFPIIASLNQDKEPVLFYFETNNQEVLYHSIMFGFPVMIYFKQPVANPWNLAYTQDWSEVQSAYLTGDSLKRFGTIPVMPVKINNIYSFYLKDDLLLDTTMSTRDKLLGLKK